MASRGLSMFGTLRTGHTLRPLYSCPTPFGALAPIRPLSLSARARHITTAPAHRILSSSNGSSKSLPTFQSLSQHRFISLGSIFNRAAVHPTPDPSTIAGVARLEAEANASPHDVEKQLALFEALVATKHKAGYESVIARWERMSEFDPKSPLLRLDSAFRLYLSSLVNTGRASSVAPAVRRRETLLASPTATATLASESTVLSAPRSTESLATPIEPAAVVSSASAPSSTPSAPATSASAPPSSSQAVADSVLSGESKSWTPSSSVAGSGSAGNPDFAKLAAALGGGAGVNGNPIHVTLSEPKGSWVPRFLRFLVITGVSTFFLLVVLAVMLENSGLLKAGGSRTAEFEPTVGKTVKFSDVHGVDEAKDELKDIVEFLKDPTMFSTLGGRLPKGVLLTGPPGTGKTLLARAVAGEAGVPFLFASGSEFDEMFVGVGAKRVRELFQTARKKQPAIIFIDELDAIGGKRSSRDQHYMKQTLNQLLVEMDGFQQDEGVIVIAATNFPESLDQALVRPGRFDRHVTVPLPDIRGRAQILVHHMKDVTTSEAVDTMILARGTPGFSGADLQNMVNQAAIQASKEGSKEVTLRHFEWAKDRIVMGAESKSRFIGEDVKKMTAYHEGGHALVALYTDGAMPLHKVTCVPRGHALGVTSQLPENDRYSVSLKEYLAEIDVCMGGRVAEELIYGPENVTSGASSDIKHATDTATRMVKYWGYSSKVGPVFHSDNDSPISAKKREEIESEVRDLIIAGESRVSKLLKEKENELHLLANALVEHETLDMEEVKKVIKGERIRAIEQVINEDITRISSTPGLTAPETNVTAAADS